MKNRKTVSTSFDKQDFNQLIDKYLDRQINLEELKMLANYYESFQNDSQWTDEIAAHADMQGRMLSNILNSIQDQERQQSGSKIIQLFKSNVFRYAAAASVLLFVFFNAFYSDFNLPKARKKESVSISNTIKIGSDKAVLTTEDGRQVVLEKGKSFTSKNLQSNGEELIYNNGQQPNSTSAYNYLTIPRGGEFFVTLADGTQVWLNSDSKLKYPVAFTEGETRKVELVYGEAYFKVSPSSAHKGAKFRVLSGIQEVEVIGTQFNIKAYRDEDFISTTLVEGKVAVGVNNRKELLKPNEQLYLDKLMRTTKIVRADVYSETAWKKGLFAFENKNLKEIMKVLSRWYDVDVVFEDKRLEKIEFNGVLNKNQNIDEILTLIKKTKFINAYEIKDNNVIIKN